MARFLKTVQPSAHACLACLLIQGAFCAPAGAQEQSPTSPPSISVEGSVGDAEDRPITGATVSLVAQPGAQSLSTHTDPAGRYRFATVPAGSYQLRAEKVGYGARTVGPVALRTKELKRIDLRLNPLQASGEESAAALTPEFFEEPHFTVAGVTDTSNLGGHGSDTVVRVKDALAKDTASLSREVPAASPSAGAVAPTENWLRHAAANDPANFDTHRALGTLLLDAGKPKAALPFLERACSLDPGSYEAAYDLARAYANAGDYDQASAKVEVLLARRDKAELHRLLGDIAEKQGNSLRAVRAYQRAAELDPSEPNLFDWGAELLLHRAFDPAAQVFAKGNRLFPQSARLRIGLGVSEYGRGAYDLAAQYLCAASDLNPASPPPYLLLGKMLAADAIQSPLSMETLQERLERFAKIQPQSALANYYYALSLWKGRKHSADRENSGRVESLLKKAVLLDPKLGAAYLQLGILYSERQDTRKAIAAYQKATEGAAPMEEAHYRLSQAYRKVGDRANAQKELRRYRELSQETAAEIERQRHEVQQFVYTLRDDTPGAQLH
jgi:tetratricopeptide (TPR) repeat protein